MFSKVGGTNYDSTDVAYAPSWAGTESNGRFDIENQQQSRLLTALLHDRALST